MLIRVDSIAFSHFTHKYANKLKNIYLKVHET